MAAEKNEKGAATRSSDVLCIGAGLSGVCLGSRLAQDFPKASYHIYEKEPQLGGTWYVNRYPGIACDIPGALYSYSFEPNPNWSKFLPPGEEVLEYVHGVARKYGVDRNTSCGCEVVASKWDEGRQVWCSTIKSGSQQWVHESKALITATGVLAVLKGLPEPETMKEFKGRYFHSARWPEDVSTEGKDLVVVGNGCTGVQIVAATAAKAKSVTQLFNSKHWCVPRNMNFEYPGWLSTVLKYVPFSSSLFRFAIFLGCEADGKLLLDTTPNTQKERDAKRRLTEQFMRNIAPEKYHDMLIPDFEIGCKRRIANDGYYESLHRDNVKLTPGPITSVNATSITTPNGTYPADIIVFATGFKTNLYVPGIEITGAKGTTLTEVWKEGPRAYHGTSVPGFPNFFMIVGPNSVTGNTSVILATENHVNYALKVLKPVLTDKASVVEVREEAEQKWESSVQENLGKTVYNTGTCFAWYREGPNRRNSMIYPFTQWQQLWEATFPTWNEWNVQWKKGKSKGVGSIAMGVVPVMVLASLYSYATLTGKASGWFPGMVSK